MPRARVFPPGAIEMAGLKASPTSGIDVAGLKASPTSGDRRGAH